MNKKVVSAVFLIILSLSLSDAGISPERIKKTIIKKEDLTRDGKPEKIVLHVTGKDIRSPFTWTIEIFLKGRRIFYKKHVDTEQFDGIFSESDIFDNCNSYESCKLKWYFVDIMQGFFYPLGPVDSKLMKKKVVGHRSYDEIKDLILQTGKASLVQANRIVEDLKRDIESGKAVCINPGVNPVAGTPVFLWIPVINDFIEVAWE